MNKKVCCTCKVVVLLIKPFAFLTFSLPSPLSFPKRPNMVLRRRCHLIWTAVRLQEFWFCFYSQCTLAIVSNSMWLYFQTLNDPSCFFLYHRYRRRVCHLWFHFGGSLERVEIATPHLPPSAPFPLLLAPAPRLFGIQHGGFASRNIRTAKENASNVSYPAKPYFKYSMLVTLT